MFSTECYYRTLPFFHYFTTSSAGAISADVEFFCPGNRCVLFYILQLQPTKVEVTSTETSGL